MYLDESTVLITVWEMTVWLKSVLSCLSTTIATAATGCWSNTSQMIEQSCNVHMSNNVGFVDDNAGGDGNIAGMNAYDT